MEEKYTEYKVLEAGDAKSLAKQVVKALSEGWVIVGGIAATPDLVAGTFYSNKFYQAMVK